ncbi:cytochrome c3 family protein [Sulfurimonas sp. CS5]|uniref:cytochrome c3 family protein n=1 Tax=Sulfurimonas sp. CS5 TaxID=3391145 RepID=UPI0039EC68BB
MSNFKLYIILIMIFSSSVFADENNKFNLINPPQNHISEDGIVSIVISANHNNVDYLKITTNIDEINVNINSKRTTYCESIELSLGINNILISGYKDEKIVKEEVANVYVSSKVYKDYKYPPDKFDKKYFHTEEKEKICSQCHDMSNNEVNGVAFTDVSDSNCYQCHNKIVKKKYAHAPAVNWLCTSCHNSDVGMHNLYDKGKSKFIAPDPISLRCFSCHKELKSEWEQKRFIHEPTDSGRCNKCHNPHASNNPNYLRIPVWKLCTSCHKDKINDSHVVKTFSNKKHPTRGVNDPSRPGKELSCISCHNPHVSNTAYLLESGQTINLCVKCHKK